jgi:hypothetical protein
MADAANSMVDARGFMPSGFIDCVVPAMLDIVVKATATTEQRESLAKLFVALRTGVSGYE